MCTHQDKTVRIISSIACSPAPLEGKERRAASKRNPREEVRPVGRKPHGNHAVGLFHNKKEDVSKAVAKAELHSPGMP